MHTVIVEAGPAIALRALAAAGEIFLLARIKKIMLARYVMDSIPSVALIWSAESNFSGFEVLLIFPYAASARDMPAKLSPR